MKKKLTTILKWGIIVIGSYLILSTLIFGYSEVDYEKGYYNYYWSGIEALWIEGQPFGFKVNQPIETEFDGIDGPYVFDENIFSVNEKNELIIRRRDSSKTIILNNPISGFPGIRVFLKESLANEPYTYPKPEKLIAISDIEGNFRALFSFLLANKVIDSSGNWIYGSGHLVFNGDFVDRGSKVTEVLWLIYHLENQAAKHQGKVHFIIGNHEILNMCGYANYNDRKYIHIAKQISNLPDWDRALAYLYSQNSEIGKWLRTKNIVEKIGDMAFVHGGINKLHRQGKYSFKMLNDIARKYYGTWTSRDNFKQNKDGVVVSSPNSPYWDRRLNLDFKTKMALLGNGVNLNATTQQDLDEILNYYDISYMVIGHSLNDDITIDYDGKVVKIDVTHGSKMKSGKTKGILFEDNTFYKIDDLGNKYKLSF